MRYDLPPMILQPAEVKSAHWVSLRCLMSPHLRTFERQDVSDRFFRQCNQLTRRVLRSMVGQLLFTARKLVPTESSHSRSMSDYTPVETSNQKGEAPPLTNQVCWKWHISQSPAPGQDPTLVLWGLTYGIVANFLGLMPTDDPTTAWDWPTLSPWDIRFTVWILTYSFRMQKLRSLAHRMDAAVVSKEVKERAAIVGLDTHSLTVSKVYQNDRRSSLDIVNEMLDGYFDRLRKAVWIALAFRFGIGTLVTMILFHRYYRRRLPRLQSGRKSKACEILSS